MLCGFVRKHRLIDKLWNCRLDNSREPQQQQRPTISKRDFQRVFKLFSRTQLEILWRAVDSAGGDSEPCLLGPGPSARLCCSLWRWPESESSSLSALPWCGVDSQCSNPFHSALWLPCPNALEFEQSLLEAQKSKTTESSDNTASCDTGFYSASDQVVCARHLGPQIADSRKLPQIDAWCHLAYWEQSARVGELFPVLRPTVSVLENLLRGMETKESDAFVIEKERDGSAGIRRVRSRIGLGFVLFRLENDDVWLYNRGLEPLFVHSNSLRHQPANVGSQIWRLQPGYCMLVHRIGAGSVNSQLSEPAALLVSFGKGWGPKFKRPFITCCPCWIEAIFAS